MSDEEVTELRIAETNPPPPLLQFRNFQHDVIGTLEFVGESMKFTGDVEASAKQFFDHVIRARDERVQLLEQTLRMAQEVIDRTERDLAVTQGFHAVAVKERDLERMRVDRMQTPGFAMDTTKAIDKVHTLIYMAMLAENAKPEAERQPVTVRVMIGGVPV